MLLGLLKRFYGALCSVNLFEMEGDGVNCLLVAADREEPQCCSLFNNQVKLNYFSLDTVPHKIRKAAHLF